MTGFDELNDAMSVYTLIHEISIRVDKDSGKSDLHLFLVKEPYDLEGLKVIFRDVADFKCNLAFGGGWTQVSMLGIREMNHGHERPLIVAEIEYDNLSFRCNSAFFLE